MTWMYPKNVESNVDNSADIYTRLEKIIDHLNNAMKE